MNLSQKTGLKRLKQRLECAVCFSIKGIEMEKTGLAVDDIHSFSDQEREALYQTIFTRRDVRGHFTPDPIDPATLSRVLMAAHYAPSVGFMQPWSFIVIQSKQVKKQIHGLFETAHKEATGMFEKEKQDTYKNLKLEGILESPVNICITCDRDRAGPVVLGRTHIKTMDIYSSVCAVQNLWLAARAEGLGLGWVSILDESKLKQLLGLPENVVPVAYICLGHVTEFLKQPELQSKGWRKRLPLADLVNFDGYEQTSNDPYHQTLLDHVRKEQEKMEEYGYQGDFVLKND